MNNKVSENVLICDLLYILSISLESRGDIKVGKLSIPWCNIISMVSSTVL